LVPIAHVDKIEIHPNYDRTTGRHDLAKIFIKEESFDSMVFPRFATETEISGLSVGSQVFTWGYGTSSDVVYTPHKHLFSGIIRAVHPIQKTLLVKNTGDTSRPGDSGAPVYWKHCHNEIPTLLGINIGQASLNEQQPHSYFLPLHDYSSWIKEKFSAKTPRQGGAVDRSIARQTSPNACLYQHTETHTFLPTRPQPRFQPVVQRARVTQLAICPRPGRLYTPVPGSRIVNHP